MPHVQRVSFDKNYKEEMRKIKVLPFIDWYTVRLIPEIDVYRMDVDDSLTEYGVSFSWICFGIKVFIGK